MTKILDLTRKLVDSKLQHLYEKYDIVDREDLAKEVGRFLQYLPSAIINFYSLHELDSNGKIEDSRYSLSMAELEQIDKLLAEEIPEVYKKISGEEIHYQCVKNIEAISSLVRSFLKQEDTVSCFLSLDTVLLQCGNAISTTVEDIIETLKHENLIQDCKEENGVIYIKKQTNVILSFFIPHLLEEIRNDFREYQKKM